VNLRRQEFGKGKHGGCQGMTTAGERTRFFLFRESACKAGKLKLQSSELPASVL
jgi:hypothetical protein